MQQLLQQQVAVKWQAVRLVLLLACVAHLTMMHSLVQTVFLSVGYDRPSVLEKTKQNMHVLLSSTVSCGNMCANVGALLLAWRIAGLASQPPYVVPLCRGVLRELADWHVWMQRGGAVYSWRMWLLSVSLEQASQQGTCVQCASRVELPRRCRASCPGLRVPVQLCRQAAIHRL